MDILLSIFGAAPFAGIGTIWLTHGHPIAGVGFVVGALALIALSVVRTVRG